MKKQANRKLNTKTLLTGAGVSFLGAFFTSFFTAPVNGDTSRQKVSQAASYIKKLPARTKDNMKTQKEKFLNSGELRYELIHSEMDELRKEARVSAKQEKKL